MLISFRSFTQVKAHSNGDTRIGGHIHCDARNLAVHNLRIDDVELGVILIGFRVSKMVVFSLFVPQL